MPLESREADRIRLTHMLDAARQALSFARNRRRYDLDADAMLRRAVLHCIQEIGEAASKVSAAGRARAVDVPWKQIVGMRQRLVHDYFEINLDLVWLVLDRDLVPLTQALETVLAVWDQPGAGGQTGA